MWPAGLSDVSPRGQRRRRGLPNQPDFSEQARVRAEVRAVHGPAVYPRDAGHPSLGCERGAVFDRSSSPRVSLAEGKLAETLDSRHLPSPPVRALQLVRTDYDTDNCMCRIRDVACYNW